METNLSKSNLAELEVRYRLTVKASEMKKIISSKDAEEILRFIWDVDMNMRERFYMLLLNRANKVIGWYKVSEGGTTGTVADVKLIFSVALTALACYIILAHNHPSENLQPSEADIKLTKKLKRAGEDLDVRVLDHLILSTEGYFSFADEGLI